MTQVPAWHTPIYPEFRESPPWVMEDMIQLEPRLADDLQRLSPSSNRWWSRPRKRSTRASQSSSSAAGRPGTPRWPSRMCWARHLAGATWPRADSRSTPVSTLDAAASASRSRTEVGAKRRWTLLEAARGTGATTALVTADPAGPLSGAAHVIIKSMTGDDSVVSHDRLPRSDRRRGRAGARLAGQRIDAHALRRASEASIAAANDARAIARGLHGVTRILTIGSGADGVAARELSLKIEEAAYLQPRPTRPRISSTATSCRDDIPASCFSRRTGADVPRDSTGRRQLFGPPGASASARPRS